MFKAVVLPVVLATSLAVTGTLPTHLSAQSYTVRQVTVNPIAAQTYSSGPTETLELLLPAGGSVLMGPNAQASVSVDPETGQMVVTLNSGNARIAAGASAGEVTILASGVTMVLANGAAFVSTDGTTVRTHLLRGEELTVTANGKTRTIYRPGFQVTASAGRASAPRRLSAAQVMDDLYSLSLGIAEGVPPSGVVGSAVIDGQEVQLAFVDPDAQPESDSATAEAEGLSNLFSENINAGLDNNDNSNNRSGSDGSGPSDGQSQPFPDADLGNLDLASVLPENSAGTVSDVTDNSSIVSFGVNNETFQQGFDGDQGFGSTANVIYQGLYTQTIDSPTDVGSANLSPTAFNSGQGLSYFRGNTVFGLRDAGDRPTSLQEGLFLFDRSLSYGGPNVDGDFVLLRLSDYNRSRGIGRQGAYRLSTLRYSGFDIDTDSAFADGFGALANALNFGTDLGGGTRESDNFVLFDIESAEVREFIQRFELDSTDVPTFDEFIASARENVDAEGDDSVAIYFSRTTSRGFGDQVLYQATSLTRQENPTKLLFAAGDLDGLQDNPSPGASVDRFTLSPGLPDRFIDVANRLGDFGWTGGVNPEGNVVTNAFDRGFLRNETWTNLVPEGREADFESGNLMESDFIVVTPEGRILNDDTNSVGEPVGLIYADFGLATATDANGNHTEQVASISATVGRLRFDDNSTAVGATEVNVSSTDIYTVGSSRSLDEGSTFLRSQNAVTAFGGNNPGLDGQPGRLGFLVLQNAGYTNPERATTTEAGTPRLLFGGELVGTEQRVGSDDIDGFGTARLAMGVEDNPFEPSSRDGFALNADGVGLEGYVAGFVETVNSEGAISLSTATNIGSTPTVRFTDIDAANNSFGARFDISGEQLFLGEGTLDGVSFSAGNAVLATASEYAAVSTSATVGGSRVSDAEVGLISGDLVGGVRDVIPGGEAIRTDYQHVKWGFFFGEADPNGGRDHINMATFAAGNRLTDADVANITRGEATYRGHLIGNVRDGRNIRTVAGTYTDNFNFGDRSRGEVRADFDGVRYRGNSSSPDNRSYSAAFRSVSGQDRRGRVGGNFVAPLSDDGKPSGVVGSFEIFNGNNDPDSIYFATGSVAAQKD